MKNSPLLSVVLFLFSLTSWAQNDYRFFDNFSANNTSFELRIKSDEASKSYKVKICASQDLCEESISLSTNYDLDLFISTLTQMLNSDTLKTVVRKVDTVAFTADTDLKRSWKTTYETLMKDLNKKEVLTELYDKQNIEYSGKLKLAKSVTLKFKSKIKDKEDESQLTALMDKYKDEESIKELIKLMQKYKDEEKIKGLIDLIKNTEDEVTKKELIGSIENILKEKSNPSLTFKPKNASVRFFNNRLNTIAVHGTIEGKEYTLLNSKFSVPFKFVNSRGSVLDVQVGSSNYVLQWNDLLDYNPDESEFSYAVKNKSYAIKANEEIKIESRNLFDYFTGIIFTDFLGLSNANNSLLMAEGRAIIPMAFRNRKKWNAPQYFEAYLNTSVYNGQEEGQGFVEWSNPILTDSIASKISMFEFFKKRNIETGLNYGILSFEWKNISSIITLDYGVNFYRSRLKYIKDAEKTTETFQAYALGHGPKLKIEIRPQVNFGADVNIGAMGYNFNGFNNSIDYADFKNTVIEQKTTLYNMLYLTTNFYTKLNNNESNDGLYFRLAGFYDLKTSEIAPQIMAGYATNLTSFINKFKKKDE
jgi:hypothetical protein